MFDERIKKIFLDIDRDISLSVSYNHYDFSKLITSEMHLSLADDLNL